MPRRLPHFLVAEFAARRAPFSVLLRGELGWFATRRCYKLIIGPNLIQKDGATPCKFYRGLNRGALAMEESITEPAPIFFNLVKAMRLTTSSSVADRHNCGGGVGPDLTTAHWSCSEGPSDGYRVMRSCTIDAKQTPRGILIPRTDYRGTVRNSHWERHENTCVGQSKGWSREELPCHAAVVLPG